MRILLDTNIVLDLLLDKEPFSKDAMEIFSLIESKYLEAYLCATTITTIHNLISKSLQKNQTDRIIEDLLQLFHIAEVHKEILLLSLKNNAKDFEDSVLYTSAKFSDVDVIITRDKKGFKNSSVLVQEPKQFLASLIKS
ncbi:PIN domain-containing protein [Sulfurimonas sp. MAG313]|nr:PIN domain-containing protein [Sulfurimonas sp. MAG313]MDF1882218.1 PIN domain-containing protein [Sulfurimonas sp. MAG313]